MSPIPQKAFRAYDIRAVYPEEINEENVAELGQAFATMLLKRRIFDCVAGYDCRLSSRSIFESFITSLIDSGITVYDIDITLSQLVYYGQYVFRTPACAMITASHNPKEYNGFKLGLKFSETMLSEEIQELYTTYHTKVFQKALSKGTRIKKDIFDQYCADLSKYHTSVGKHTVVVDGLHDTSGLFLPKIFSYFGCTVIEKHTLPDGSFPLGTPDPTEKKILEMLGKEVVEEKADVGFSYDPDGDRIGIVDERGTVIWNDTLVALFAKDVLEFLPHSPIVFNTLCSKQTSDVITASGGVPHMWITGHSYIAAKIKELRAPYGGELSGHMFFADNWFGHEDTSVASLRLLSYLTRTGKSLSKIIAEFPSYISTPEIKIGCPDEIKNKIIESIITTHIKKEFPHATYSMIDGIRADTKDEMIIIRSSQNAPYITIRFEARTKNEYDRLKDFTNSLLCKIPEIDFSFGVNLESLG